MLKGYTAGILNFDKPRAHDLENGFFHYSLDDGAVYDETTQHLGAAHSDRVDHYTLGRCYYTLDTTARCDEWQVTG